MVEFWATAANADALWISAKAGRRCHLRSLRAPQKTAPPPGALRLMRGPAERAETETRRFGEAKVWSA